MDERGGGLWRVTDSSAFSSKTSKIDASSSPSVSDIYGDNMNYRAIQPMNKPAWGVRNVHLTNAYYLPTLDQNDPRDFNNIESGVGIFSVLSEPDSETELIINTCIFWNRSSDSAWIAPYASISNMSGRDGFSDDKVLLWDPLKGFPIVWSPRYGYTCVLTPLTLTFDGRPVVQFLWIPQGCESFKILSEYRQRVPRHERNYFFRSFLKDPFFVAKDISEKQALPTSPSFLIHYLNFLMRVFTFV